uniref:Uncharacterized protein n=1 Tax=Ditylenchus dipsaci TaxID=166011 RepID=A0A915EGP6_9BILA
MAKIVVLCPTRVLVDPLLYYDMESRIGNVTDYSGQRLQNATLEELDKMAHAIITKINTQFQLDSVEIKKNFKDSSDLGEPDNQAFCQNIVISSRSFSDENPSGNIQSIEAMVELLKHCKNQVETTVEEFVTLESMENRAWQQRIGLYGAHEIAHSLSSPHEETYPDSINAEYNCTTGSSLMQHEPKRISEQMSECTKNAISEFLNFAINTYTNCLKIVREKPRCISADCGVECKIDDWW